MKKPHSLKAQMAAYLVLIILIIALFGQVLSRYFEIQYSQKLLRVNADAVTRAAENIRIQYMTLSDALESFATNKTVIQFLSSTNAYERLTLLPTYENLLISYKKMNSGLRAIVLKRINGEIFSDASAPRLNIASTAPLFNLSDSGASVQLMPVAEQSFVAMIRNAYQPGSKGVSTGKCMFIVDAETLTDNIHLASGTGQQFFVLDQNKRVITANHAYLPGDGRPLAYQAYLTDTDATKEMQDEAFIAVSKTVPEAGLIVLCLTSRSVIFSELSGIRKTTILLLMLMLLLVALVFIMQSFRLSSSFRRVLKHMSSIAQGNAASPLVMNDSTEFQRLAEGFNEMLMQLNTLYENNLTYHNKLLQQELENKQSQLLALQSQINPHFLYNTLECINSAGAVCGSREVEKMSTALAYIFRYAIKGENVVRIQDELETLRYYLDIQKIRFPGRFDISYDIPDDIKAMRVLKFILQPIVENAISHGFKDTPSPCRICIQAQRESDRLVLTITDNGTGMTKQTLAELQARLDAPEADTASIGLPNIQRRIRLYYGDAFGIILESTLGKGTRVTLNLPILEAGGVQLCTM